MDTSTTTFLSRRLSSLGKLDKAEYVEQYIRSQKSIKIIPERGPDASNSTPLCDLSSITRNNAVDVGFDTPVLKARAVKADILDLPGSSLKHTHSSDQDTEKRLAYRRQRKKAKREIVNPKKVSKDGEIGAFSGSRAVAKRNKFSGVSLGLPSMNKCVNTIGNSRLTIEPSLRTRVGVFSKGKTSSKPEREKPSKKTKRNKVPETRPSNARTTKKSTASDVASLSENSSTNATSAEILDSKQGLSKLKCKQPDNAAKRNDTSVPKEISLSNSFHVESGASECPSCSGSVAWDIEMENFSFTTASVANHAPRETDVSGKDNLALTKPREVKDLDISITADVQRCSKHNSDISLRPSESASQPKDTREPQETDESAMEIKESKYFSCATEPTVHMTLEALPQSGVLSNVNLPVLNYSGSPDYFYRGTGSPAPSFSHVLPNHEPVYSEVQNRSVLDISLSVEDWLPLRHEDEISPSRGGISLVSALHLDQFGVGADGEFYAFSDCVTIQSDSEQGYDYVEDRGYSNMNQDIDSGYSIAMLDPLAHVEDYLPFVEEFDTCYGEQPPEIGLPQRSVHPVYEDCACTSSNPIPSTWLPCNLYDGMTDYIQGTFRNSKTNVELDVAKSLRNHWLPQKL